jgi:gliding-associated putative ABC transporter substrate-binding component GldG
MQENMKKSFKSVTSQAILITIIVIVVNILSLQFYFRLDFTADKRYTLNDATKDILRSLNEPVTVTAYFTEDVPAQLAKTRKDFKEMLIEYGNNSGGMVVYEFIDPNKDPESERKAMQEGIMPSIVNVRERDQMMQKRVFMGAVLKMGDEKDIIPVIQPGTAMEYSLSSSIKKLSVIEKPLIGLLRGHGEAAREQLQEAFGSLEILYQVEDLDLSSEENQLGRYAAIAIINPSDTIPPEHLQKLDGYLENGGNIFIAMNKVEGNFSNARGTAVFTGLEDWLSEKGMTIEESFVVDASCGSVGVQQRSGFMNFTTQVSFPYLPRIKNFEDHPITKGLEEVMLQFASPINFTGDTTLTFTPIVQSSDKSGTQTPPLFFDINKQWNDNDFPLSNLTVGAVLSGPIEGSMESKIVLITDGEFGIASSGRQSRINPDNLSLLVNSIDWLSDETGLIDLRTKAVTSRPLDEIDDSRKVFLKWMNFLLPIILIVLYGIVRMQMKRRKRNKRMEEGYV